MEQANQRTRSEVMFESGCMYRIAPWGRIHRDRSNTDRVKWTSSIDKMKPFKCSAVQQDNEVRV